MKQQNSFRLDSLPLDPIERPSATSRSCSLTHPLTLPSRCCQRWEGHPSRGREQEHCALFYKQLPVLKALCFLSVPPGIQNYRNGQNEIFHRLSCKSALQLSKTTKPAVMNDMPASQRFGNTLLLNRDGLPIDLLSKFFCFYLLLPLIIIHLCFTRVTNLY